jgi:hypothetical protein
MPLSSSLRILISALLLLLPAPLRAQHPDLTGTITSTLGKPVENATVMVWTAGVKQGYSTFCPSCYADCGKNAQTAPDGSFTIPSLDPDLLFRIVIVAEGHRPTFVSRVDPAEGPISAAIEPRPIPPADSRAVLRGRILDEHGTPIEHAVITPRMVWFLDGGGRGGAVEGLDPLAMSNTDGEFALAYKEDCATMDIHVEARGFAMTQAERLATGSQVHTIVVYEGATIAGRILKDGKPLPGVLVGAAQPNRHGGFYLGDHTIGTDDEGRFLFSNIPIAKARGSMPPYPSPQQWNIYAKMDSIKDLGASAVVSTMVTQHGAMYEVPDVEIVPGLTLTGRVILSDGAPIPEGMRIFASPSSVWDSQTVPLAPDGSFRFENLPPDEYSINPAVKGYFLSRKNPSLSWSIEGRLDQDLHDLIILMEPGAWNSEGLSGGKHRGQPLRSIDPADLPSPP